MTLNIPKLPYVTQNYFICIIACPEVTRKGVVQIIVWPEMGSKLKWPKKDLKWTKMTWNEHNDPKYPKMTLCDPKLFHLHYRVSISDPKVGRAHYRVTQNGLEMTQNDSKRTWTDLKWLSMNINDPKYAQKTLYDPNSFICIITCPEVAGKGVVRIIVCLEIRSKWPEMITQRFKMILNHYEWIYMTRNVPKWPKMTLNYFICNIACLKVTGKGVARIIIWSESGSTGLKMTQKWLWMTWNDSKWTYMTLTFPKWHYMIQLISSALSRAPKWPERGSCALLCDPKWVQNDPKWH